MLARWLRSRLLMIVVVALLSIGLLPLLLLGGLGIRTYEARSLETIDQTSDLLNEAALQDLQARSSEVAFQVARFMELRERDVLNLASFIPDENNYLEFAEARQGIVWAVDPRTEEETLLSLSLYRQVVFLNRDGMERVKVENVCFPPYPFDCVLELSQDLRDVSDPASLSFPGEDLFAQLRQLTEGEVYVSLPTGNYVPLSQAYGGQRNRFGARYEGVVWLGTPIYVGGQLLGYGVLALDQTHLIEFVAHLDPTGDRPVVELAPQLGNFAYVLNPQGAALAHVEHSRIAGRMSDGSPAPAISAENPLGVIDFSAMGFLNPTFPNLLQRAERQPSGVLGRVETPSEAPRSLAYAIIPYYTGPNYDTNRGFGVVVTSVDSGALNVGTDLFTTRVRNDVQALIAQFGGTIGLVTLLIVGFALFMAVRVVAPVRSVTHYAQKLEQDGLDAAEIAELRAGGATPRWRNWRAPSGPWPKRSRPASAKLPSC
ncbi:MAG: hypothetical protein HC915_11525 [Anaerolineae bacterium]|nr:hypothetical protein [Anaerolineae bacterium]